MLVSTASSLSSIPLALVQLSCTGVIFQIHFVAIATLPLLCNSEAHTSQVLSETKKCILLNLTTNQKSID